MTDHDQMSVASSADVEQAIAHALLFDGRRAFRASGEMMAKITAAHLVEQLKRSGFVILKKPEATPHTAPPGPEWPT